MDDEKKVPAIPMIPTGGRGLHGYLPLGLSYLNNGKKLPVNTFSDIKTGVAYSPYASNITPKQTNVPSSSHRLASMANMPKELNALLKNVTLSRGPSDEYFPSSKSITLQNQEFGSALPHEVEHAVHDAKGLKVSLPSDKIPWQQRPQEYVAEAARTTNNMSNTGDIANGFNKAGTLGHLKDTALGFARGFTQEGSPSFQAAKAATSVAKSVGSKTLGVYGNVAQMKNMYDTYKRAKQAGVSALPALMSTMTNTPMRMVVPNKGEYNLQTGLFEKTMY